MGVSTARLIWIIEVTQARGSAPREAATRMLVSPHETLGTIGGGHLEWQAIQLAREAIAASAAPFTRHFALGPALGQCCGGAVDLRFAPLTASEVAAWPEPPPRFTVQLYGAGHVGQALVRALAALPCRVHWLDERDSAEAAMQPLAALGAAHVTPLVIDSVEAEVAHAPDDACHIVMTHSHDLDLRIVESVLRHGQFRYLGLIGSATKKARFLSQLSARGFDAAALTRITCPIGVPGISGKEPEVIAVAVAAQLLALD
jgi:xanthine dehydrogenase accessory factor